jgi:hypothetical protein
MNKRLVVTACFMLLAIAASAETAAPAESVPTKQEVLQILEVMQIKARVSLMMQGVGTQARLSAEQSLKEKIPDATPQELAKVDEAADAMIKQLPINEMMAAMVPIYQKHLTKSDLQGMKVFFSSRVGQKLLREQPAMMSEAMKAATEIAQSRMGELNQNLDTRVSQIIAEEQQKRQSGHPAQSK